MAFAHAGRSGVELPAGGWGYPGVDALITNTPRTLLTVLSADCVPILLAVDDGTAVASVHAGWRGAPRRWPPMRWPPCAAATGWSHGGWSLRWGPPSAAAATKSMGRSSKHSAGPATRRCSHLARAAPAT
ncbi:MAG: hypothetical protein EXR43_00545 [Dehalococcoidia bacterium]|nr:hypothetical protein [Dehalococcoidia bacterium]